MDDFMTSTNQKTFAENQQRNELISAINDSRCILCLGENAFLNEDGKTLKEALIHDLKNDIGDGKQVKKGVELDLFTMINLKEKTSDIKSVRKLFKIGFDEKKQKNNELFSRQIELYEKISRIPFHVIISTHPSELLREIFKYNKIDHRFYYYNRNEKIEFKKKYKPTKKKPLIYNLFGSIEEPDSMVVKQDHFYSFMEDINSIQKLPLTLRETLQPSKNTHFLFLGFDFENWYMKILLHILDPKGAIPPIAHIPQYNLKSDPSKNQLREATQFFFNRNFQLKFEHKDLHTFINELFDACKEQDILRKIQPNPSVLLLPNDLTDLIDKDKIKKAFSKLINLLIEKGAQEPLEKTEKLRRKYKVLLTDFKRRRMMKYSTYREEAQKIGDQLKEIAQNNC